MNPDPQKRGILSLVRRMLEPKTSTGVAGLLGASMVPGVGEAIDIGEIGMGLADMDAARIGFGILGLATPFVGAAAYKRGIKKAVDRIPVKPLRMGENFRKARMRKQGWNPREYYHGRIRDFDSFEVDRPGRWRDPDGGLGVFVTRDPELAGKFAKRIDPKGYHPYGDIMSGDEDIARAIYGDAGVSRILAGMSLKGGPNTVPLRIKSKRVRSYSNIDRLMYESERKGGGHKLREHLEKLGYDAVSVKDDDGSEWFRAIFDPSNVRSRWATFDPRRLKDTDMMAGIAALLAGGVGAQRMERRER